MADSGECTHLVQPRYPGFRRRTVRLSLLGRRSQRGVGAAKRAMIALVSNEAYPARRANSNINFLYWISSLIIVNMRLLRVSDDAG
jgi:hypothetical protein